MRKPLSQAFWWGVFHGSGMSKSRLVTTDLYFVNACGHLIHGLVRKKPVRALGANSFSAGSTAVVVRRDFQRSVRKILGGSWDRLIYVVDDDIEAGLEDANLPGRYRLHLDRLYRSQYRPLLHAADVVVTGSDQLADRHAGYKDSHRINPYWEMPLADSSHFDALDQGATLKVAYLGAISHAGDLEWILPVVDRVMAKHTNVEFTAFLPSARLERMAAHANVKIKPLRTWARYKNWVGSERFHLALYPTRETPFNFARSVNKLIEHTVIGAVGIYSANWQHAHHVKHDVNGFLAENSPEGWELTIELAIEKQGQLKPVFEQARKLAARLNDRHAQEVFWQRLLGL